MSEQNQAVDKKRFIKTIPFTLKLSSELLFKYLQEEGGKSTGALERMGSLLRMLVKEEGLTLAVNQWLEKLFDESNAEVEMLLAQKENLKSDSDMGDFKVCIPENYKFEFEVAHPSVWKLIKLIGRVDNELNEIENIWLLGDISDADLNQAKLQALAIIRRAIHKIYSATAMGKREGGKFSPVRFINVMRQSKGMPEIEEKPKAPTVKLSVEAETKERTTTEVEEQPKAKPKGKAKPKAKAKTKSVDKPLDNSSKSEEAA